MQTPSETTTEKGSLEQFLSFKLGKEYYGINILRVQEIKGWETTTPIPNTPDYLKGVINLRGSVIPIIDLRIKFLMEKQEYDKKTVVIVTKVKSEKSQKVVGLVVDSVSDTQTIDVADINDAPDLGYQINVDFIKGITSVSDNMLIILDIDKLVNIGVLDSAVKTIEEE